jgi:enamine deaminase RidA (YjgF/YER057c/UK114 family)
MRGQLQVVYKNLATTLEYFGVGFESIVKETIFTTDIKDLMASADIRAAMYRDITPPSTTGVQVAALALPELLVEIDAVAHLAKS